ncbi:lysylphosphatidylglycerol synthase transmembrane domain-containing protein, partial [Bacteroides salyersiae]
LYRWKGAVETLTDNLVISSHEMSHRSLLFWLKVFGMTCISWISRYLVVNALLVAFTTNGHQLLAFVRQLILWIVMTVSPTPGGSGVSEYMFRVYYADFFTIGGMALLVAFIWRMITYYMYLFIGVCILPGWLRKLKM